MDELYIRKATVEDLVQIVAMQNAAFHGEQGIPEDSVENFSKKEPLCWCGRWPPGRRRAGPMWAALW